MGSMTKGDWMNMNPFTAISGTELSGDTTEARDEAAAQAEEQARANKAKITTSGVSTTAGDTGGGGASIPTPINLQKKKKSRAGTTSAQIPTTGVTPSTGTGLGGI